MRRNKQKDTVVKPVDTIDTLIGEGSVLQGQSQSKWRYPLQSS